MRKPRDYDTELKALDQRAKALRTKQRDQLAEIVIATGAHTLPIEVLAGALLAVPGADQTTMEAWRVRGASFFRGVRSDAGDTDRRRQHRSSPVDGDAQPVARETRA